MHHRPVLAAPVLAALFVVSANAQPADGTGGGAPAVTVTDRIVVSATRTAAERRRVGSSVTVIDRAEIERRDATTVADLLATVPGVEVVRTGGPGGGVSVFVRGANSSHTLVLVDGIRMNSTVGSGAFDFADLTADGIERIEVLRGPQSALYGSEAIGGVISIFSRRGAAGLAVSARAAAGSRNTRRLAADLRGGAGRWDWNVAAADRSTEGVSRAATAAGNHEADRWENTTAAGGVGAALPGGGEARLALRWVDATTGLDGFDFALGPVDDPNYDQRRRAWTGSLAVARPVGSRWTQHLRLGVADEHLTTRDPDPEPAFHRGTLLSTTTDAEVAGDLRLSDADTVSIGYAFERREGSTPGSFAGRADLHSAFVENRFAWGGRLDLTTGVRRDDHSTFGAETTWRTTASWRTGGALRLHGAWGTGFKAPTFVDLYYPYYGNPDLAPETSRSVEAGVEASRRDGHLLADLTAFRSRIDQLIAFDTTTFRAENIARARVSGWEARLAWDGGERGGVDGSYTRTDAADAESGAPLPRRPRHRVEVTARFAPRARLSGSVALVAARDRVDSGGVPLRDYAELDATAELRLGHGLAATLRLDNLLDERVERIAGYTTPGFGAAVGLRYGLE